MSVPEIDVEALAELHAAGATIVDVRQPDEYEEAHVPGAVLIPLGEVQERVDEIPADGPVYVICSSGARSMRASEWLVDPGHRRHQRRRGHHGLDRLGPPGRHGRSPGLTSR